ncbi:phage integrase SAM-like domain-containing protein [Sphingobacterium sp. UT-1RO-CII-1]|uniref:phage integrase SAM-like domain-containing protein n=1 Tax=Sphingobacterium sp. UT-1RO-CII-1 TaxID=2995225 RepID=UPI00227BF5DB|nr:phage integrase SAM-like domain-containing protein [Sphingobacterium sp. UT-1RO-CII-1]MCY4781677.1 phage integrase SAM-like domain-containing protein [Sphingobacterium sp. UT-1RO-CII-1]
MATVDYVVFKHHRKSNGTYNIKYRLTHRRKQVYKASSHYVVDAQLKPNMTIKDYVVLKKINRDLEVMRDNIGAIGFDLDHMTADDVLQRITESKEPVDIDFIKYCKKHLDKLQSDGKQGTHRARRSAVNHLIDYTKGSLDVNKVTTMFLRGFENFLKKPRIIARENQFGGITKLNSKGLERSGIFKVMTNIRTMHNMCRKEYNSTGNILVTANPFEYYDMPVPIKSRKKGSDLSIQDIINMRDADLTGRAKLGRDIFMLSFYMCGLNMVDMYESERSIVDGRLEYSRSKVKDRRSDEGFISIKIPAPALPLLEQYTSEYLQRRYSNYTNFNAAVNKGLGEITFYHARHTFATLASKEFGHSDRDIGIALNHSSEQSVTSRYIDTDWSIIDKIQADVLSLISANDKIEV